MKTQDEIDIDRVNTVKACVVALNQSIQRARSSGVNIELELVHWNVNNVETDMITFVKASKTIK